MGTTSLFRIRRRIRNGAAGVIAVLATMLALTLGAAPAHAAGYSYDGTNPATAAGGYCANGSYAIASYPIVQSGTSTSMGTMEVRYSPSCGTNWVRAYTSLSGYSVQKIITRTTPNYYSTTPEYDPSPGWSYGMQVYAPGSTCVVAEARLYPSGGGPFVASSVQAVC